MISAQILNNHDQWDNWLFPTFTRFYYAYNCTSCRIGSRILNLKQYWRIYKLYIFRIMLTVNCCRNSGFRMYEYCKHSVIFCHTFDIYAISNKFINTDIVYVRKSIKFNAWARIHRYKSEVDKMTNMKWGEDDKLSRA